MMQNLRLERIEESMPHTDMPLLTMLEELRDFKATFAHDKIYGILGLVGEKDEFVVDYALEPEQVFTDLAVRRLKSGTRDVLAHCVESSKETTLTLPPWVPDWTRPGWTEPHYIRGLEMKAAGDTKPVLSIDEAVGVLRIKGRMLDTLAAIETKRMIPPPSQPATESDEDDNTEEDKFKMQRYGDFTLADEGEAGQQSNADENKEAQPKEPTNDARYRLKKALKKVMDNGKAWHLGAVDVAFPDKKATPQTWESLWRAFMCNRTRDNERSGENCATGMDIAFKVVLDDEKGPAQILQERVDHQISSHGLSLRDAHAYYMKEKGAFETFTGVHSKWCHNRRFFRSEGGRFGWGVDCVQPEDAVVMFYGCDSVFVLRKVEGNKWKIIGDCYLDGLMDGEGLGVEFEETEFQIV